MSPLRLSISPHPRHHRHSLSIDRLFLDTSSYSCRILTSLIFDSEKCHELTIYLINFTSSSSLPQWIRYSEDRRYVVGFIRHVASCWLAHSRKLSAARIFMYVCLYTCCDIFFSLKFRWIIFKAVSHGLFITQCKRRSTVPPSYWPHLDNAISARYGYYSM